MPSAQTIKKVANLKLFHCFRLAIHLNRLQNLFNNQGVKIIMSPNFNSRFLNFLQRELSLNNDAIAVVQRSVKQNPGPLPMVLWQYGLVTLEELDQIYDWLEQAQPNF